MIPLHFRIVGELETGQKPSREVAVEAARTDPSKNFPDGSNGMPAGGKELSRLALLSLLRIMFLADQMKFSLRDGRRDTIRPLKQLGNIATSLSLEPVQVKRAVSGFIDFDGDSLFCHGGSPLCVLKSAAELSFLEACR